MDRVSCEIDGLDCNSFLGTIASLDDCSLVDITFKYTFTNIGLACVGVESINATLGPFDEPQKLSFGDIYTCQDRQICNGESWTIIDKRVSVDLCKLSQNTNPWDIMIEIGYNSNRRKELILDYEWDTYTFSTMPTSVPSLLPSEKPSLKPSLGPSESPSSGPTFLPSVQPSANPTLEPSLNPTEQPSGQPSLAPSTDPTLKPSLSPSNRPSSVPSELPSMKPSLSPTKQPSSSPSFAPSLRPSSHPSLTPSAYPTSIPSHEPTLHPSTQPSLIPSSAPSVIPTVSPSNQPSISSQPTICEDSVEKFLVQGTLKNEMRSCDWVKRGDGFEPIPWRCRFLSAKENCPKTCGICSTYTAEPSVAPRTQQPSEDDCANCVLTTALTGGEHHSSSNLYIHFSDFFSCCVFVP